MAIVDKYHCVCSGCFLNTRTVVTNLREKGGSRTRIGAWAGANDARPLD